MACSWRPPSGSRSRPVAAAPRLVAFDLAAKRQLSSHGLPRQADVLAFDPGLGRLYVASETGTIAVFAVRAGGALGEGFVGPDAHTVAVDPESHHVYFPLADVGGRPVVLRIMRPR
jgi:DNA-binding beta-propeller fold protein YncE